MRNLKQQLKSKLQTQYFKKRITLSGYITPLSWDEEGNPTRFSLYTFDDLDIPLISDGYFRKLKKNINQVVEITGIIEKCPFEEDHLKIIKMKRKNNIPTPAKTDHTLDDFFSQDWSVRLPHQSFKSAIGQNLSEAV